MKFKAVLITAWIWFPALATAYGTESGTFQVCNSSECIQRAKLIIESLNTSIDPCTDFYSYVCDRWESNHPLPSGWRSYDVYEEIRKDIPEMLSYILGNRTLVESSQTIIDKVATMYNACLALPDTPDSLIRVLNESGFNAWPIVTEENIYNSSNCSDLLRHMDISSILYVDINKIGYTRKSMHHYEIYLRPMRVQEKIEKMTDIAAVINNTIRLLNPGIDSSMLDNLTKQLVEFSKNLSNAMLNSRWTAEYNIYQLDAECGNKIPISALLKKEFKKVDVTLNDTQKVNVHETYCKQLNTFLDIADPNTLYNYAGFLALFPYLEYVQMSNESVLTISTTKGRNWSECITVLHESARDVLDYLYITNESNHTAIKNEVEDITRRLIEAFNETLQNNRWIGDKVRQAFEKELKAPLQIGYLDGLLNTSVLEDFYKYVPYFPSNISFTEAFYYFQQNLNKMKLRTFRHPEEANWRSIHSPREVRGTFSEKYGIDIEIPYPILVSPVFQRGLPRSLNYGGIGGTIARELGYTFSINGVQTMPRRQKGLQRSAFSTFIDKTSCFEQQYKAANNRMLRELQMEGEVLKSWAGTDQALADNTGLQVAFKAYSRVLEDECANVDTRLTGLENITGMQLFFISNARTQCTITDKDWLHQGMVTWESVTPARNRVNEAMKNLEGFAKAFNCSLGSRMRPNKTCPFW